MFCLLSLLLAFVLNVVYQCISIQLGQLLISQFAFFRLLFLVPLFLHLLKLFVQVLYVNPLLLIKLRLLYFRLFLFWSICSCLWIWDASLYGLSCLFALLLFLFGL